MKRISKNKLNYLQYNKKNISYARLNIDEEKLIADYIAGPSIEAQLEEKRQWLKLNYHRGAQKQVYLAQKKLLTYAKSQRKTYNPTFIKASKNNDSCQKKDNHHLSKDANIFNQRLLKNIIQNQSRVTNQHKKKCMQIQRAKRDRKTMQKLKSEMQNQKDKLSQINTIDQNKKYINSRNNICYFPVSNPLLIKSSPSSFYAGKTRIQTARCRY